MPPIYKLPPVFRGPSYQALPMAGEVNWGMDVFNVEALRGITRGKGFKIGVVDTGADRSHPLLANVVAVKDFTNSNPRGGDPNGHGSHVTGTVGAIDPRIGVANECELFHGQGLDNSGSGGNGLINAMGWCIEQGCKVLSCSWGGGGRDAGWDNQFREWSERGIWMIFAGGNSGANTPDSDWPGRSEHLFNVAALARNLSPANFSSAGDKLDTSGPGVDIISARSGGGFVSMSGTSMATPFVAGVLGLYFRALELAKQPIPTVYDLRKLIAGDSTDIGTPGDDRRTGPGWITPILLALNLVPDPPPVTP